jgi:hypothetical protein
MVFNTTFNNISVALMRSVLLVEEMGVINEFTYEMCINNVAVKMES